MDTEEVPFLGTGNPGEDSHDVLQKRHSHDKRKWNSAFVNDKLKKLFQLNSVALVNLFAILVNLYWFSATWGKSVAIDRICPEIPYCKCVIVIETKLS